MLVHSARAHSETMGGKTVARRNHQRDGWDGGGEGEEGGKGPGLSEIGGEGMAGNARMDHVPLSIPDADRCPNTQKVLICFNMALSGSIRALFH